MSNLNDLLFIGFSTNLILSCLLTVTAFNAVSALAALIFAFINTTCLFFLMELEFVGLLFLIVYVGAISVLFLFSVMLFNLKDVVRSKTTSFVLKRIVLLILLYVVTLAIFQYFTLNVNIFDWIFPLNAFQSIYDFTTRYETFETLLVLLENSFYNDFLTNHNSELYYLGQVLYNRYVLYLILTAIVLLIAMIGAVILINNPKEQIQMQHASKQITRNPQLTNLK